MHQTPSRTGAAVAVALAAVVTAACASAPAEGPGPAPPPPAGAVAPGTLERAARADSVRAHYTDADVAFMTGMIHHHAQALVMSQMAPTHGASESMRILTARIINGQRDEIALMQRWLRERDLPVPQVPELTGDAAGAGHGEHAAPEDHAAHGAGGMAGDHPMSNMAGMLSPEQMAELDAARGEEWDRLFLTFMIQHHKGALTMVEELFSTYGAGQGDEIFKIASDIGADQASEIDRMQRMLQELMFGPSGLD